LESFWADGGGPFFRASRLRGPCPAFVLAWFPPSVGFFGPPPTQARYRIFRFFRLGPHSFSLFASARLQRCNTFFTTFLAIDMGSYFSRAPWVIFSGMDLSTSVDSRFYSLVDPPVQSLFTNVCPTEGSDSFLGSSVELGIPEGRFSTGVSGFRLSTLLGY